MNATRFRHILGTVVISALALSGCGRPSSNRTYEEILIEPRVQAPAVSANPSMPSESSLLPLAWDTPPGWVEQPGSQMRIATFQVNEGDSSAECSIIVLPGDVGGRIANLERWLGQIDVQVPADQLKSFVGNADVIKTASGHDCAIYNLGIFLPPSEPGRSAILAGVMDIEGAQVFIKLSGPRALVDQQARAFVGLCSSIRMDGPTP